MTERYVRPLAEVAIRTILPSVVGAVGALVATLLPIYHNAFCGVPV